MKVKTIYRCDICLKESEWGKNWATYIFPIDVKEDMSFHICSEYCYKQLASIKKSKKVKLYYDGNNRTKS